MRSVGCVLLELETDQGLNGESYVFTLNGARLRALHEMLLGFSHLVEGKSPYFIAKIEQSVWEEMNPIGHQGFSIAALSAIDTACWDLLGKVANLPLHQLFGGCRERIKTYASGGLWLSQTIDQCVAEAVDFVAAGFRAMKIRVSGNLRIDLPRVRAVREAIGDDIELLADANQSMRVKQAIRLSNELAQFQLAWIEEPVIYHDIKGCGEVRAAVDIAVAAGESVYTRYGVRQLLDARAVDILMPDLQRIGGLSEMRRVAALAASCDIPISTHIFTEHSLSIAGSEHNCISVEHIPWFAPLFNETIQIEQGEIIIPQRPGHGFTFNREAISRFVIA